MKTLVVLILSLVAADTFGQRQLSPTYYLNSEEIDFESVFIKPSSIDKIDVDKKTERGAIYITTKQKVKFLTLDDILKKNSGIVDSTAHVVYIVDEKLITDKSKAKVDAAYFIDFKIRQLEKVYYVDERYRDLAIVEIKLLNEKPKPVIRIRGDEELQTRN